MSRAYRIRVRESLRKILCAEDHVSTQLELLQILPADQMAGLLEQQLLADGFEKQGELLVRKEDGLTIEVNPADGTVTVRAEEALDVNIDQEQRGYVYEEMGKKQRQQVEDDLRKKAQKELEEQAALKNEELQKKVTERLEAKLGDLQKQLDKAVNRATAEALKQKARQLGEIKEMTEDEEAGSLTIIVEV